MPGPNRYDKKGRLLPKRPKKYVSGKGWSPLTPSEQKSPWVPTVKPTRGERIAESGSRKRIRRKRRQDARKFRREQAEKNEPSSVISRFTEQVEPITKLLAKTPTGVAIDVAPEIAKNLAKNPKPTGLLPAIRPVTGGRGKKKKERLPGNAIERRAERNLRTETRKEQVAQRQFNVAKEQSRQQRRSGLPKPANDLMRTSRVKRQEQTAAKALDRQRERREAARLEKQLTVQAGQIGSRANDREPLGPQSIKDQLAYVKRVIPRFAGQTKRPAQAGGRTPQEVLRGIQAQNMTFGKYGRKTEGRGSNISETNLQVARGENLLADLSPKARTQQVLTTTPQDRRRPTQREYLTNKRPELIARLAYGSRETYKEAEEKGLPEGRLHRNPWALSDAQAPDNETPEEKAERERRVVERMLINKPGEGFEALDANWQQDNREKQTFLEEFFAIKSFEKVGKDTGAFFNHVTDALERGDVGLALTRLANDRPGDFAPSGLVRTKDVPDYDAAPGDYMQVAMSIGLLKAISSSIRAGVSLGDDVAKITAGLVEEGAKNPRITAMLAKGAKIGEEKRYGRLAKKGIEFLGKPGVQKAYRIGAPTTLAAGIGTTAATKDLKPILLGSFTANFGEAAPTTARALIMGITAPVAWAGNLALTTRRGIGAIGSMELPLVGAPVNLRDNRADPYYSSADYIFSPVERLAEETWAEMKRMYETYTSKDVELIREATEEDYGYITLMSAGYLARPLSAASIAAAGRAIARTPAGQAVVKQLRQSEIGQRIKNFKTTGETIRRTGVAIGRADAINQKLQGAVRVPKQQFNSTREGKRVNKILEQEKRNADDALVQTGATEPATKIEVEDLAVMLTTKGRNENISKEQLREMRQGVPETSLTYRQITALIDNYDSLLGKGPSSNYFRTMMAALRENDDILSTVRMGRTGEDAEGTPLSQSRQVRDLEVKQQELLIAYGQQYGGEGAKRATQKLDDQRAEWQQNLEDARLESEQLESQIKQVAERLRISKATAAGLIAEHKAKVRADKKIQKLDDERMTLEDQLTEIEIMLTDPDRTTAIRNETKRRAQLKRKLRKLTGVAYRAGQDAGAYLPEQAGRQSKRKQKKQRRVDPYDAIDRELGTKTTDQRVEFEDGTKVLIELRAEGDEIRVTNIVALPEGTGAGSKVMSALEKYADETGRKVILEGVTADEYFAKRGYVVKGYSSLLPGRMDYERTPQATTTRQGEAEVNTILRELEQIEKGTLRREQDLRTLTRVRGRLMGIRRHQEALFRRKNPRYDRVKQEIERDEALLKTLRKEERPKAAAKVRYYAERVEGQLTKEDMDAVFAELENDPDLTARGLAEKTLTVKLTLLGRRRDKLRDDFEVEDRLIEELESGDSIEVIKERIGEEVGQRLEQIQKDLETETAVVENPEEGMEFSPRLSTDARRMLVLERRANARSRVERLLANRAALERFVRSIDQLDADMTPKQRRDRTKQSKDERTRLLAQIAARRNQMREIELRALRDMDGAKLKALITQRKQEKIASYEDEFLSPLLMEITERVERVIESDPSFSLPTFISNKDAERGDAPASAIERDPGLSTPKEQARSGSLAREGREARTWKEQVATYERELRREKNRNLTKWVAGFGTFRFVIDGKERTVIRRDEFPIAEEQYRNQTGRDLREDGLYIDQQFLDHPDDFGSFINILADEPSVDAAKGQEVQSAVNRAQGSDDSPGTFNFSRTLDDEEFSAMDRLTEKIGAGEQGAGRGYVFINKSVALMLKKQQAQLNIVEKGLFELNRISSRLVLGTSLSWMLAQPVAELAVLAAQHPIRMWPALAEARKLQKLNGDGWLAAATLARGLPGTDPIVENRNKPTTLSNDAARYKELFGIMKKLPGWMVIEQMQRTRKQELAAQVTNLGLFGRFDKWKGAWIREAGLLAELDSSLKGMRKASNAIKGQMDAMEKVSTKLAAMKTREEQLNFLLSDEGIEAGMELAKRIDDQLGNWTDLRPGIESTIGQLVFFYPFVRFSLNWALRTYPRDHPVTWTMATMMGVANAEMLERMVNYDPAWPGEWIVAPIFGGRGEDSLPTHLLPVSRYASAGNVATELVLNDAVDPSWALATRVAPPLLIQPLLGLLALDPFGEKIRDENDPFGEADPGELTRAGAFLDNLFNLIAPFRDINRFASQSELTDGVFSFQGLLDPSADTFREPAPFTEDDNPRTRLLRSAGIAGWPLEVQDVLREQEWNRRAARVGATSATKPYEFEGDDWVKVDGRMVPFKKFAKEQMDERREQIDQGGIYAPRPKRHQQIVTHYLNLKKENAELRDENKAAIGRLFHWAKKNGAKFDDDNWLKREMMNRRWQRVTETKASFAEEYPGGIWPGFKEAQRMLSVTDDYEPTGDGVVRAGRPGIPDPRTVEGRKEIAVNRTLDPKTVTEEAQALIQQSRKRLEKQGYRRLDTDRIALSALPEAAQKYNREAKKIYGGNTLSGSVVDGLLDPETTVVYEPPKSKKGAPKLTVKKWRGIDVIGEPSIEQIKTAERNAARGPDSADGTFRIHKELNALMMPKDYARRVAADELADNVNQIGAKVSKQKAKVNKLMIEAGGVPSGVPEKYRASVRKWGAWLESEMKKNGLVQPYETAIMDGYGVLPQGMSGAEFLSKILQAESGWDETIGSKDNTSRVGAMGLGQFIPGTRASVLENYGVDAYGDADQQIHAAAILLSKGGMENYNSLFPNSSDDPVGKGGYHYYYEQDVGEMVLADKNAAGKIKKAQQQAKALDKNLQQAVKQFEKEAETLQKQGIPAPNPLGSIGGGTEGGEPRPFNGKFMGARKAVSIVLGQPVWGDHMPAADGSFRGGSDEVLGGHDMGGQHALSNAYAQDIGNSGGRPEEGEEGLGYDQPTIDKIVEGLQKMGSSIPDDFKLGQDWQGETLPNGYQPLLLTSVASNHGDHVHFGMQWVGKGASSGSAGGGSAGASYGGGSGGGMGTTGDVLGFGLTPNEAVNESIQRLRNIQVGGEGQTYDEGGVDSAVSAVANESASGAETDEVKSVTEAMAALPSIGQKKKKKVPRFSPENRI
jgi:hypothetical protein